MKKTAFILICGLLALSCNQSIPGSGKIISDKRSVGNFNGVSSSSSIDVEVKSGSEHEVVVEGDDNIIRYVKTEIVGGILKIGYTDNISIRNADITVYVTAPALNKLSASSSSNIRVTDVLSSSSKITFKVSSSASIKARVEAPEIDVDANSSADIELKGKTKNLTGEVSSSAEINCYELMSENAVVSASSSGILRLHASVSLNGKASSSGDIRYRGGATVIKSESSSGSVEKE